MKGTLAVPLVATTLLLGGICLCEWKQIARQNEAAAALRDQLARTSRDLSELQAAQSRYEHQRQVMFGLLNKLTAKFEASHTRPAGSSTAAETATVEFARPDTLAVPTAETIDENEDLLGRFNPHLTENAEMEDFIRNRLWLALDQLNNPLVKSLGMTPEETGKFKDLIVENLVQAAEKASAALDQGPSAVESGIENALAADRENFEVQVKQLLGNDRYAQYEAYKEDYSQFNQIKFLNGNEPLTDDQTGQILAVMIRERQAANSSAEQFQAEDAANQEPPPSDYEQEQQRVQIQKFINQRVYEQLKNVLSPNQLAAFAEFQARRLERLSVAQN